MDESHISRLLILLVVVNIPLYYFVGRLFYKSWRDVIEGLGALYQPGGIAALGGEEIWQAIKVCLYIVSCAALVMIQYRIFS